MNLKDVANKARVEHRKINYVLSRARMDDLLDQIEKLKPLLLSGDPQVVLRASQEIRDIHAAINEISKCISLAATQPQFSRRKWIKISERKKKAAPPPAPENIFRPQ